MLDSFFKLTGSKPKVFISRTSHIGIRKPVLYSEVYLYEDICRKEGIESFFKTPNSGTLIEFVGSYEGEKTLNDYKRAHEAFYINNWVFIQC